MNKIMKRLVFMCLSMMAVGLVAISISSCKDDPIPMPTVDFVTVVTNYEVDITVESTNATTFLWEYGDTQTSAESVNHKHTYAKSGTYAITVTVTNESGTATKTVSVDIAASLKELLAGTGTGKIWILDNTAETKLSKITPTLEPLWAALPANALAAFGLQAEYDNEYTFKPNNSLAIAGKNGAVLTGLLYASVFEIDQIVPPNSAGAGLTGGAFADLTNGEYTINEKKDLVLQVANEDYPAGTNNDGVKTITFTNANYLTFKEGTHFGVRDFTTTVLIRSITASKMEVTFFLSTLNPMDGFPESVFTKPSIAISASVKVKP
jgi:PKD repeat protein